MPIEREDHGTTHRIAMCHTCDWSDGYGGTGDSIERVTRSAKQHTVKTGHHVTVESGKSFTYKPKDYLVHQNANT